MSSRQALGRGLRALIPERGGPALEVGEGVRQLPVEQIVPNPFQPRRRFAPELLDELAESIKAHGVLEPVVVRAAPGEGAPPYQLVVGERRWRAAQLAGLATVPALVRSFGDREMVQMALVENLQREDLNAMEEAEAYQRLVGEFGLTHEEVARVVGRKRPTVANTMRLLELEPEIQELIRSDSLSGGHGKALLALPAGRERVGLAKRVASEGLSVRQCEEVVRRAAGSGLGESPGESPGSVEQRGSGRSPGRWNEIEAALARALGTRVVVREGRRKGRIEIEFYGQEELVRLLELLSRLESEPAAPVV